MSDNVLEVLKSLRSIFSGLSTTDGNEPIRCSRMHFDEWQSKVNKAIKRITKLEAENERLRDDNQFCDEHKPNGGVVGTCQRCAIEEMAYALSRIDYCCGEPNDQLVSGYDLHCDEELVVVAVTRLKQENERLRGLLKEVYDCGYRLTRSYYEVQMPITLRGDIREAVGDE